MVRGFVAYAAAFPLMLHQRCAMLLPLILLHRQVPRRICLILQKERLVGRINILLSLLLRHRSPVVSIITQKLSISILRYRRRRSADPRTSHNLAGRAARPRPLPPSREMPLLPPGSRGRPIRPRRPTRHHIRPSLHCGSHLLLLVSRGMSPGGRVVAGAV